MTKTIEMFLKDERTGAEATVQIVLDDGALEMFNPISIRCAFVELVCTHGIVCEHSRIYEEPAASPPTKEGDAK